MRESPSMWSLALTTCLLFATACATPQRPPLDDGSRQTDASRGTAKDAGSPGGSLERAESPSSSDQRAHAPSGALTWGETPPVRITELSEGRLQLALPVLPLHSGLEQLSVEELRPLLLALDSLRPMPRLRLREVPGATDPPQAPNSRWELQLRNDFFSRYGAPLLSLSAPLESSRLLLALKLSTRSMDDGIREAAEELFRSPLFLASVALSITVYFAAWLAPEPFFSKAFAAALTVRLSLLVGLVELGRLAQACIRLYQEVEVATSHQEIEAASARFGRSMGGVFLRTLVVVASFGVPQVLPKVPQGGLWTLLSPLRHAPSGGPALESIATAQIVADGSLVVVGGAAGTSATALCGELATCTVMSGSGGATLSTRYGKPHTRQNPPHNEAIEHELAGREAAGHSHLRKNKPQKDAADKRVKDPAPARGTRFRKPDAASIRPDGVRHNTNYVSNSKDMKRELEAFDSMVRADPKAIHELYLLDGTLVRRYIPQGVGFP